MKDKRSKKKINHSKWETAECNAKSRRNIEPSFSHHSPHETDSMCGIAAFLRVENGRSLIWSKYGLPDQVPGANRSNVPYRRG